MTQPGRAGRDGEPSECILLYGGQDVVTNQFFIDHNQDNQEMDALTRDLVTERDRLRKMTFYCFTNECLRDYILRYFGEYGANTAKISQYRMDENPHYGELAKVPTYKLRQVMNYLMLQEYLAVTNDEYAVVKLTGKSKLFLEENETVTMKMAKEQEHPAKAAGEKKGKKSRGAAFFELEEEDEKLFEVLRRLRSELAKKEGVPSNIVFSDKSLVHMCVIRPVDKNEMLSVSGVGEFKFEKYGEAFLEKVIEFNKEHGKTDDPDSLGAVEFSSLDYDVVQDYEGDAGKSGEGLFELKFINRMPLRKITEYGTEFGIEAETQISSKGNEYEVFYYTQEAQRGVVELLMMAKNGGK